MKQLYRVDYEWHDEDRTTIIAADQHPTNKQINEFLERDYGKCHDCAEGECFIIHDVWQTAIFDINNNLCDVLIIKHKKEVSV